MVYHINRNLFLRSSERLKIHHPGCQHVWVLAEPSSVLHCWNLLCPHQQKDGDRELSYVFLSGHELYSSDPPPWTITSHGPHLQHHHIGDYISPYKSGGGAHAFRSLHFSKDSLMEPLYVIEAAGFHTINLLDCKVSGGRARRSRSSNTWLFSRPLWDWILPQVHLWTGHMHRMYARVLMDLCREVRGGCAETGCSSPIFPGRSGQYASCSAWVSSRLQPCQPWLLCSQLPQHPLPLNSWDATSSCCPWGLEC